MLQRPIFILVLEDETLFTGGFSYKNTKWLEIPNKKIKRVFYSLPHRDYICLENYDNYYHFVEATKDLNGKNAGQINVENAYIIGKKENNITCYKISLSFTGNKRIGDVQRTEYKETDEFIQKLNPQGWK